MIKIETADAVAVLTIDRAERRNALNVEHLDELRAAVARAQADGARAVVVTGAGSSFCAGADFSEVYGEGFRSALYATLSAIREAPMPVVAAVNGPAIGAGTQLALACDLRVASPEAVFGVPTAQIGLAVDPWTIRRLASLVGAGVAAGIVLGCDQLDAHSAHQIGLVNRVGELEAALGWAAEMATFAPLTLDYSKRVLQAGSSDDAEAELAAAFERCWSSEDLKEGRLARAEKRRPEFRGA